MADNFSNRRRELDSPGARHKAIVPSNTVPVSPKPRVLFCQVAGDVAIADVDGTVLIYTLAAGQVLPFRADKVMATGTTATVYGWE